MTIRRCVQRYSGIRTEKAVGRKVCRLANLFLPLNFAISRPKAAYFDAFAVTSNFRFLTSNVILTFYFPFYFLLLPFYFRYV